MARANDTIRLGYLADVTISRYVILERVQQKGPNTTIIMIDISNHVTWIWESRRLWAKGTELQAHGRTWTNKPD